MEISIKLLDDELSMILDCLVEANPDMVDKWGEFIDTTHEKLLAIYQEKFGM